MLPFSSALIIASARASDGHPLRITASVGEVHKYRLTATVTLAGKEAHLTASVTDKVTKVDENGDITTEESRTNVKVEFDGREVTGTDGPPILIVTRNDGTMEGIKGAPDNPNFVRLTNIETLKLPDFALDKDKAWSYDVAPDGKTGAVKAHSDYKVAGSETVDGIDCWKISVQARELSGDHPASAESTVWLAKSDGLKVKSESRGTDLPSPDAPVPLSGTEQLELVP